MALVLIKFNDFHPIEEFKLRNAKAEDTVVLIQDGVYWGLKKIKDFTDAKVVAIKEDVKARGYSEDDMNVELIDYHDFVDVVEKEEKFIG